MNRDQYISPKKACEILGVHFMTLKNWEKNNDIECIRTLGGKRLYNVNKYLRTQLKDPIKRNICYCRVSTRNQKDDLERQISFMKEKYPKHEIFSEIGSGLNMNRKKLLKIVKYAIEGNINEVVVAHKDRLTRFGFELIETIIETYSHGKIIILNDTKLSPQEEITQDLLSIINVFSARVNGLRKYKKQLKDIP
jgi:putative resolvase